MANRHYDTHMDWYTPVPVSADLRSHVVCAWTAQIQRWHSITPDGCVDVVWTSAGDVRVCGPETSGWSIRLPEGTRAVGVRLRPGVAHSLFSVNMGELRDRRVEFADLVGPACAADIRARVEDAPFGRERALRLVESVTRLLDDSRELDDWLARTISTSLARRSWDIAQLARDASLTTRQLHRRSVHAFGYGASTLRAVLRLQRFMSLARSNSRHQLVDLAYLAGFSDQAHLIRESHRFSGLTPSALLASEAPGWHGNGTPWWDQ